MNGFKKTISIAAAVSLVCLSSVGAMATSKLIVKAADGTTDKFIVSDSTTGTIGVGTSSPIGGVNVYSATYPNNTIKAEGTEGSGGGGFLGYNTRTTTTGGFPISGDRLGFFLFGMTSAGVPYHAAGISAMTDGNWSSTSTPAYFSFATTAIGTVGTAARLERLRITSGGNTQVFGGIQMSKITGSPTKPACTTSTDRGIIWYTEGATGVKDALEVCAKDASNNYAWRTIY